MGWTLGIDLSPIFSHAHENISTKGEGGRAGTPGKETPSTRQFTGSPCQKYTGADSRQVRCGHMMGIRPHARRVVGGDLGSSSLVSQTAVASFRPVSLCHTLLALE